MARPHIEFIHSQLIPFKSGLYGGGRSGIAQRTLSIDPDNGASSLILRYDAQWSDGEPHHLQVDEELFVLEGEIRIGDVVYGKHDYAHLPAGFPRETMNTRGGAVVLTFFSAEPKRHAGLGNGYDERRLVRRIDTRGVEAHQGPRKHMASEGFDHGGTVHKSLWHDPDTDERSWLVGLPPYWSTVQAETHPVCEEEFAIYGDICMPNGVMHAGAYFWRPEYIQHGPFGTVGGTLHFCRARGGAFSTEFEAKPDALNWNPDYRPILPPDYAALLPSNTIAEPNY